MVGGSDQELSQAAPYAHICYRNPTPQLPPSSITANQHHQPTTSDTHQSQPPLMPPTTSIRHCTTHHGGWQRGCRQWGASVVSGSDGWWQLMAPVGGSGGLQGEKTSKKIFCSKWAKKPKKQHVFFLFFPHLGGGWVCQKQVWNFPHFFWTLS